VHGSASSSGVEHGQSFRGTFAAAVRNECGGYRSQAVSVASLSSGVVDEQGAAISGVQVRRAAVDTGVVYNSVSNADGIECMTRLLFGSSANDANAINYVAPRQGSSK